MKARKGGNIQKNLSILTYGEQGTWKSSMGAEAIALKRADGKPMRVLVIDAEFGGLDEALEVKAMEHNVDLNNTYLVYTESYSDIISLLDKVKNKEPFYEYDEEGNETDEIVLDADGKQFTPDFIVLDGSTVIYNASAIALTKFSEKRAKVKAKAAGKTAEETLVATQGAGLELKDYNKLNRERSQELILKLISTGVHHYITARETDEKVSVKADNGQFQSVPTGKKIPEGFKSMGYNVGTVLRLYKDDLGQVNAYVDNKDRTRVNEPNAIIPEPSLLMYQDYINNNAGKAKVNMSPTSFSDAIEKEYKKELAECNMVQDENKEFTVEQYHAMIKDTLQSLKREEKSMLSAKIKEAGLPVQYQSLQDVELLKKFMGIISK